MKSLIKYVAVVFCGLLILLFIGQEGYREKIDKINIGIYFNILFLFWLGYLYFIEKFKKSEEEVNKIFSKYSEIFLIIQAVIISIMFFYILGINFFGFEECKNSIIYNVICFGITYLWYYLKKREIKRVEKKENKSENQELLFDSRENYKEGLKKLIISDDNNSMILIDGEWGIGKTFFVNKAIEELKTEKKDMIKTIEIDAMLFNSRKSLKDELFNGLSNILEKNEIIGKSVNDISEKMDSIIESENKFINIVLKFIKEKISIKNKTFSEDIEQIKKSIKKLNNIKIVVIVENIERILKKDELIEMIGFLHEMQSIEGIIFIVCADKDKLKKMIEDDKYIEKFFLQEIYLKGIEVVEIVQKIGEREENSQYSYILSKLLQRMKENSHLDIELEKQIINSYKKEEDIVEENKYIEEKRLINKLNKLIMVPREIEKIYKKIIINKTVFKNLYKGKISDNKYLEIVTRSTIFEIIFELEYKNGGKIIQDLDRYNTNNRSKEIEINIYKFWNTIFEISNEIEKRAYLRIIEEFRNDENIMKYFENFDIKKLKKEEVYTVLENLGEYYKYLDTEDKAIQIYGELREYIFELEEDDYTNVLTNFEIIKLEKRYYSNKKIGDKSIYENCGKYIHNYYQQIQVNFIETYLADFEFIYEDINSPEFSTSYKTVNGIEIEEKKYKKLMPQNILDFISKVSIKLTRSDKIKEIIDNKNLKEGKFDVINNIFIEEIENMNIEGKKELKIMINKFFFIVKLIFKEEDVKENKNIQLINTDFKNKNYSEQKDILTKIRNDKNYKEYDELKKQREYIKEDVIVNFYNTLNIVKERLEIKIETAINELEAIE